MQLETRYFVMAPFYDVNEAKLAKLIGSWPKLLRQLQKIDLLIPDDFGLHPIHETDTDQQLLLD